jgi:hypothetical protein
VIGQDGIRSLVRFSIPVRTLARPVLYLRPLNTRLYLNIFRGEPAITEFD